MHNSLAPREVTESLDQIVTTARQAGLTKTAIRGRVLVEMPDAHRRALIEGYGSIKDAITYSVERVTKKARDRAKGRVGTKPRGMAAVPEEVRKAVASLGGKAAAAVREQRARDGKRGLFLARINPDRISDFDGTVEYVVRELGVAHLDKIIEMASKGDWSDIIEAYHTVRLAVRASLVRLKYKRLIKFDGEAWREA